MNRLLLIFIVLTSISSVFGRTLYDVLGVSRTATQSEIKSAWREKAKALHPDKTQDDTTKQFIEAKDAFEILSSPTRRQMYDQTGRTGLEGQQYEQGGFYHHRGGNHYGGDGFRFTFDDLFARHFDEPIDSSTVLLNDENVLQVISKDPTSIWMIEFFTNRCNPCRSMAANWDRAAKSNPLINFARLDGFESSGMITKMSIRSVPAIFAVVSGKWIQFRFHQTPTSTEITSFIKQMYPDATKTLGYIEEWKRLWENRDITRKTAIILSDSSDSTILSRHLARRHGAYWDVYRVAMNSRVAVEITRDADVSMKPCLILLNGRGNKVLRGDIARESEEYRLPLAPRLTPDTHDELFKSLCLVLFTTPNSRLIDDVYNVMEGRVGMKLLLLDTSMYVGWTDFFASLYSVADRPFLVVMDRSRFKYAGTHIDDGNSWIDWVTGVDRVKLDHISAAPPPFDNAGAGVRGWRVVSGVISWVFSSIAGLFVTIVRLAMPLLGIGLVFICFFMFFLM